MSARMARAGLRVRGSDAFPETIDEARRRAAAEGLDIAYEATAVQLLDPAEHSAELVVCCEVLEHLPDPDAALDVLASLASPWLLASVPREPLWRALNMARGAYLRDLGNTPGPPRPLVEARASCECSDERFEVVEVRSPLPWTMALCRVRA